MSATPLHFDCWCHKVFYFSFCVSKLHLVLAVISINVQHFSYLHIMDIVSNGSNTKALKLRLDEQL